MAVILSLLASLTWGAADFLGGVATRRLPAPAVVAVSQALALAPLAAIAAATGGYHSSVGYLGWGIGAGVFSGVALTAFYAALATGTMGVVAPIAALGVVVPVGAGLALGDRPSSAQAVGLAVAAIGVVLSCGPELRGDVARRPLALAVIAALGFGAVIIFVARGARSDTVMTLLVMRTSSAGLIAMLGRASHVPLRVTRHDLPLLAAVGAGDVGANAMYAVASRHGLLAIVAVLSSLYPVITVLLARVVFRERMTRTQDAGVIATLAAVALIAGG